MRIKCEEKRKVKMENHESKKQKRFHGEKKTDSFIGSFPKGIDHPLDSYNYQFQFVGLKQNRCKNLSSLLVVSLILSPFSRYRRME